MNGGQDLGGMQGFGPVMPEADEPLFHAAWEPRALAVTLAMGATGMWNIDMSRHARERIPPPRYLTASYYQIWTEGLCTLLVEAGLATPEEIASGRMQAEARPVRQVLAAENVAAALARGAPTAREMATPARFAPGDRVRTLNINPPTHTRLPRYARGRTGIVEAVHGGHVFADSHAHGRGEDPQWLYGVVFPARELWGPQAHEADSVRIDMWEPYLVAA